MKSLTAVLFCVLLLHPVQVFSANLEVSMLSKTRKEIASGTTSNLLVMFTNHTDAPREFEIKLRASGFVWKQIINYSSVQIESNAVLNKIISIRIPDYVRAGDYSIELEAFEKPDNEMFGKLSIPIRVKPRFEIRLEQSNAPRHVLSGDSVTLHYNITNFSNTDVSVEASVMNGPAQQILFFSIPKDSTVKTSVLMITPKNLVSNTQQIVSVTASVKDKPETLVYANYVADIIPANNSKFDGYNRFPVNISAVLATTNCLDHSITVLCTTSPTVIPLPLQLSGIIISA